MEVSSFRFPVEWLLSIDSVSLRIWGTTLRIDGPTYRCDMFRPQLTPRLNHSSTKLALPRLIVTLLLVLASCAVTARADGVSAVEFSIDVMSVLSKSGCNAGTCHGNLNGKGGFKLSLRGQDPQHDFHALALASRGRRINPTAAENSLFLRKATGSLAHRGGIRFEPESDEYHVMLDWLNSGAEGPSSSAVKVVRLDVTPRQAVVVAPQDQLQVAVVATFSDGSSRDVTKRACYELSNLGADVGPGGTVHRSKFGETTLIVRYLDLQVPVAIAFTRDQPEFKWSDPPSNNEVDDHVFAKLKRLRINPSPLCEDNVFVRRAYLDAIGRLPTAGEARRFVASAEADKRARLIDELLMRPEFSDFWALKWADVLRTEEKVLDTKGVEVFHAWIRDSIAAARPLDEFVRDLVTGTGSTFENPPANFFRSQRDPSTRGETTARLFLGTRLQCAKCHNHPFDRWTQDDYYGWSSIFSQIKYEIGDAKRKDKLDNNEFAGDQIVLVAKQDEVRNPNSGDVVTPKLLGDREFSSDDLQDRLQHLATWLTSRENELFVKSQTNFIWYHIMGRGLVDPIDDFRMTNPPGNPELLDALADEFASSGFDLRSLVRTIMNSRTYQLSSEPNASNVDDETCHSRALIRRLGAEVLLDMQSDVLDVPAEFAGYPLGIRAVQIPGVKRKRLRDEASKSGDRFLKTFGKPDRILACECERSNETTLKQAFVLIGEGLNERLAAPDSRFQKWSASEISDGQLIDELFWTALSRPPTDVEFDGAMKFIGNSDADTRQGAVQDIAWALMNAKEFLFRN